MRNARIAVGHAQTRALMTDFVHLDADLVQLVHPVHVAVAHHAECGGAAFRFERLRESLIHLHCVTPPWSLFS
jgi:hypothetical protein